MLPVAMVNAKSVTIRGQCITTWDDHFINITMKFIGCFKAKCPFITVF